MRQLLITLLACICVSITAQSYQSRKVESYNSISVFGSLEVELFDGYSDTVKLESQQLILDEVTVKNEGSILKITLKENIFDKHRSAKITIRNTSLKSIKLSGGSVLSSSQTVKSDTIELAARSGSTIRTNINCVKLIADLGEGSTISVEGKCKILRVDASSGGLYNGYDLKSEEAIVKSNAGSIVKVYTIQDLDAYSSTGGQISYRGIPARLRERTVLGGKIEKLVE